MQNLYPASWLYLTGHCYLKSMFVKHHFFAVVVYVFVVAVFYYYYFCYYYFYCYHLLLLLFVDFIIIVFDWHKLDCKFFAELCKFSQFQIKCLKINKQINK